MSKVLYIKANPKKDEDSRTFQVSDAFVKSYKDKHPNDEVVTLDLYEEGIDFLRQEDIDSMFGPKTSESKNHPILKYAYQFVEADKYIISAPFWNLGLPAILKAYIDYISISGITFKYTESGPVGMCTGKKALHFVSRGGHYLEGPATGFEMGDRYLRVLFGFLGIVDFETIAIEGVDMIGVDVDQIINRAKKRSNAILEDF